GLLPPAAVLAQRTHRTGVRGVTKGQAKQPLAAPHDGHPAQRRGKHRQTKRAARRSRLVASCLARSCLARSRQCSFRHLDHSLRRLLGATIMDESVRGDGAFTDLAGILYFIDSIHQMGAARIAPDPFVVSQVALGARSMNPYHDLCDDFYVNLNLSTEM